jgi:DNA-binding HxlR family transcriptional regulator
VVRLFEQLGTVAGVPPRTDFDAIDCSISRTMAILGEPWTPLVLRDLFIGITRFDRICAHLGVSRKVLAERLNHLVSAGVVTRKAYCDRPVRYDYLLTDKGWDLCDVLLAVTAWGDRWTTGLSGPPAVLRHRGCDHATSAVIGCAHCRQPLHAAEVEVTPVRQPTST